MKKNIISIALALGILLGTAPAFAADEPLVQLPTGANSGAEVVIPEQTAGAYISMTTTVKAVDENKMAETVMKTEEENEEESPIFLNLSGNVLVYDNLGNKKDVSDIEEGAELLSFTAGNKPTPLIYPPRYAPDVVIIMTEEMGSVDVDLYKESEVFGFVTNSKNTLALNIAEDTVIEMASGAKITLTKEDLVDKNLIVFHTITTMSLPGQTTPSKIVVMEPQEEDKDLEDSDDELDPDFSVDPDDALDNARVDLSDVTTISAGEQKFEYIPVKIGENYMVPVRAIGEALGYTVEWNDTVKAVMLNNGYSFNVGEDSYIKGRAVPIELGQAPVSINFKDVGITYVPVSYFSVVLDANVTVDQGTLVIGYDK